jgi:hypothetical protein
MCRFAQYLSPAGVSRIIIARSAQGSSMKRAAIYLRVSTTEQTTANQERELREIAARSRIVKV